MPTHSLYLTTNKKYVQSGLPLAISDLAVVNGNQQLTLNWTAPTVGGGISAITTYKYSLNGGSTYTDMVQTTTSYTITGLNNGTNYSVCLKSHNSVGDSLLSNIVNVAPSTVPGTPILSVAPIEGFAYLTFSANTGGSVITNWYISTDQTTYINYHNITSPFKLEGTTDGYSYHLSMKAENANGLSASSNIFSFVSGLPSPPTFSISTTGNGQISVSFIHTTDTAPLTGQSYHYSLDGGTTLILVSGGTSPFTVSGLNLGQTYQFTMNESNINGDSSLSAIFQLTIYWYASAPTINSITANNDGTATVNFTAPSFTGGQTITGYQFSTDGTTYVDTGSTSTTLTIAKSYFTMGISTTVYLKTKNSYGNSQTASTTTITCSSPPNAPTISSLTPSSTNISMAFTAGNANGSAITNYQYNLNGGAFVSIGTITSPFNITGLTTGTSYSITLQAINANGTSPASGAVSSTTAISSTLYDLTAMTNSTSYTNTSNSTNLAGWTLNSNTASGTIYPIVNSTGNMSYWGGSGSQNGYGIVFQWSGSATANTSTMQFYRTMALTTNYSYHISFYLSSRNTFSTTNTIFSVSVFQGGNYSTPNPVYSITSPGYTTYTKITTGAFTVPTSDVYTIQFATTVNTTASYNCALDFQYITVY
jgi:hypothetical protein